MIIKRIFVLAMLTGLSLIGRSQTLAHINLVVSNDWASIRSIDVTDANVTYCVDLKGPIIQNPGSDNNLSIAYYTEFDGFDNIGKLKSIGNIAIAYYTLFDGPDNIGKLKSIGNTAVFYYTRYDGLDSIGKLKSVGNTTITYYDRFDISQPTGTIKSIDGNTPCLNIITI